MKSLPTSIFLLLVSFIRAQDIKPLDYCHTYAKAHVNSRTCYEVKFQGNKAIDSLKTSVEEFNKEGKLIRFTEFTRTGKKIAEHEYSYDTHGKLTASSIRHLYNDWIQVDFKLTFNEKGKLVTRELTLPIQGCWQKETYSYHSNGILAKSEQWYEVGGSLKPMMHKDYESSIERVENSLTYIYDAKGLLIIEQYYSGGISDKARVYDYSHY